MRLILVAAGVGLSIIESFVKARSSQVWHILKYVRVLQRIKSQQASWKVLEVSNASDSLLSTNRSMTSPSSRRRKKGKQGESVNSWSEQQLAWKWYHLLPFRHLVKLWFSVSYDSYNKFYITDGVMVYGRVLYGVFESFELTFFFFLTGWHIKNIRSL